MADASMARLVKQMKKNKNASQFQLGDDDNLLANIPYWIPTRCWPLDAIIGGGIPGGRLVELYGSESTGKSLLVLNILASVQAMGGLGLLIDPEATTTREFMELMGVDVANVMVAYPDTIEEVDKAMNDFINAKIVLDEEAGIITPGVIVWDSIAGTSTIAELDAIDIGGLGKRTMALHARSMSLLLRTKSRQFARAGITGVFVNQQRAKIGVLYGEKNSTLGGSALNYHATTRIELKLVRKYESADGDVNGIEVRAYISKNKANRPFGKCRFPLLFNRGLDNSVACFWYLKEVGAIETKGSWHVMNIDGEEIKFQKKSWNDRVFSKYSSHIKELILKNIEVPREGKEELEDE